MNIFALFWEKPILEISFSPFSAVGMIEDLHRLTGGVEVIVIHKITLEATLIKLCWWSVKSIIYLVDPVISMFRLVVPFPDNTKVVPLLLVVGSISETTALLLYRWYIVTVLVARAVWVRPAEVTSTQEVLSLFTRMNFFNYESNNKKSVPPKFVELSFLGIAKSIIYLINT